MRRAIAPAATAVIVAVAVAVSGCSAPPAAPAPAPAAAPTSRAAPAATADQQLCARSAELVRNIRSAAHILDIGPVLAPAIPLLFLASRQMAQQPGVADPALGRAATELVAAIDDLDAQSKAGTPPGATVSMDTKIQYDTKRVSAAATGLEQACAARAG